MIVFTMFVFNGVSNAQCHTIFDKNYDEKLELSIGCSSYNDDYSQDIGIMLDTKIVEWEFVYIGFGTVIPLNYPERTRPIFSLSTSLKKLINLNSIINPGISVYCGISPYGTFGTWGIGLSLLRFHF